MVNIKKKYANNVESRIKEIIIQLSNCKQRSCRKVKEMNDLYGKPLKERTYEERDGSTIIRENAIEF